MPRVVTVYNRREIKVRDQHLFVRNEGGKHEFRSTPRKILNLIFDVWKNVVVLWQVTMSHSDICCWLLPSIPDDNPVRMQLYCVLTPYGEGGGVGVIGNQLRLSLEESIERNSHKQGDGGCYE